MKKILSFLILSNLMLLVVISTNVRTQEEPDLFGSAITLTKAKGNDGLLKINNNTVWDLIITVSSNGRFQQKINVAPHEISTIGKTIDIDGFKFISPQQYIPKEKYIDTTSYQQNPGDTVLFQITTLFNDYGPWAVTPIFEKLTEKADVSAKTHWSNFFSNSVRNAIAQGQIPDASDIIGISPDYINKAESFQEESDLKEKFCTLLKNKYEETKNRFSKLKSSFAKEEAVQVLDNAHQELWESYCSPQAQSTALQKDYKNPGVSPYQQHD